MPGGRLTQPERQQIALGLADGLAYAEIARRTGRPTSTITREVMRNGGPTASELAARLQVSPASISKAVAFLDSQGLVRRERDERRRERYVVDDDIWYQAMIAQRPRQRPGR
jgi:DNA-binding MarR family transcriptional regulator